jgi:hypothetical protein
VETNEQEKELPQMDVKPDREPITDPTDLSAYWYMRPDKLIVKRYPPGVYDKGRIELPDSAKTVQNIGWIVRAGKTAQEAGLTEGQTVVFTTDSSADVPLVSKRIEGVETGLKDLVEINYLDVILAACPTDMVPIWSGSARDIDMRIASRRGESGTLLGDPRIGDGVLRE